MGRHGTAARDGRAQGLSRDARVMLAASFFYLGSTMLVNPLIAGFTGSLGGTAAFMGVVGGLMNVCSLAIRPMAGNLSDIVAKRGLATAGAVVLAVSTSLYAVAVDPVQVAVLRLVSGAGYALCSVCMSTWFASLLPPARIGSGMGMFGMMNALGMAAGPAAGLAISGWLGYRPALAFGGIMAAATVVLVRFVGDPGKPAAAGSRAGSGLRDRAAAGMGREAGAGGAAGPHAQGARRRMAQPRRRFALVDMRVVPAALIVALFTVPYMATQSFLVSYVDARGLDLSVSLFFPVYAVVLLALRFALKRRFDTVRFGPFLLASSVCAVCALVLLAVMRGDGALFAAAACMAGGYGVMCSVCQATAVRLVGPEHAGMANSTYYMGLDIGMALGPMIGGMLFGAVDLGLFYPVLAVTVPLALAVYACSRGLRAL
ncbi:MFS transporter [Candidatus Collinsella stercoripullorum]|uniref:MFS transporter n=1 Tax=Candidatus Collinsella stercoripullorum TaxID=2838522 RepID=UPI0022DEA97D|nr:MFS transporter [Candidatus Collinsella stercoripullorum]